MSDRAAILSAWLVTAFRGAVGLLFLLVPLLLLRWGADDLRALRARNQRAEAVRRLEKALQPVTRYERAEWFAQAALENLRRRAERAADPETALREGISLLKRRFPGFFRFVVWDGSGRLIEPLTDIQGFRYVLRKAWTALGEATRNFRREVPLPGGSIAEFRERSSVFTSFLGRVFLPENLALPFRKSPPPSVILSDYAADRTHFWYHIGRRIGLLCFLDQRIRRGTDFLRWFVRRRNRRSPIGLGVVTVDDLQHPYLPGRRVDRRELHEGLLRFEASAEAAVETRSLLLLVRRISPRVRVFAVLPRGDAPDSPEAGDGAPRRGTWLALVGLAGLAWLLLRGAPGSGGAVFISIRWKLAILFFYATGLPLMVLGFRGLDYLQQTRSAIENGLRIEGEQLLGQIDGRFPHTLDRLAGRAGLVRDRFAAGIASASALRGPIDELQTGIAALGASEFFLLDQEGEILQSWAAVGKASLVHLSAWLKNLGPTFLAFMNLPRQRTFWDDVKEGKVDPDKGLVSRSWVMRNAARLGQLSVGEFGQARKWHFFDVVADPVSRRFRYLLMVQWDDETIQQMFARDALSQFRGGEDGVKVLIQTGLSERLFPSVVIPAGLRAFLRQTRSVRSLFDRDLRWQEEAFAGVGVTGHLLPGVVLAALYPQSRIESVVAAMQRRLVGFGLLTLLLTFALGQALAAQFLAPVGELGEAARAIRERRFQFRLANLDQDEMGRLGLVFNQVMEGLAELEVARIVQESLFPEAGLTAPGVRVQGRSVSMEQLGGDYFDFFPVGERRVGVVLGDVAGHGVPAALIMGMAKATVLMAEGEREDPSRLLGRLNGVLHGLQGRSRRRMMTCQYALIDGPTGDLHLANAGQCFPLLLRANREESLYLQSPGNPLGVSRKPVIADQRVAMRPGDSLVFYTDGVVESRNPAGEPMGYDVWLDLAWKAVHPDPALFLDRLFQVVREWNPVREDDITLVVVRIEEAGRG